MMEYIQRYQSPKLYVIDLRSYVKEEDDGRIPHSKYNNMNYSMERTKGILDNYMLCNNKVSLGSPIDYIFDLSFFQGRWDSLANEENWNYMHNSVKSDTCGCNISKDHMFIKEPKVWDDERETLNNYAEKSLKYLLEYVDKNNIDVLFTLSPYGIDASQMRQINTLTDILDEADVDFINMAGENAPYEVDYKKDFYNVRHMNVFGAEKYTDYLGDYIIKNYDIHSHKGEKGYSQWDVIGESCEERAIEAKTIIEGEIEKKEKNIVCNNEISKITSFDEWYGYVHLLEDLTVLMALNGERTPEASYQNELILSKMGFYDEGQLYKNWIKNDKGETHSEEQYISGYITDPKNNNWSIEHEDGIVSIMVQDRNFCLEKEGILVVAIDDNTLDVVDNFALVFDGELRRISMERR